MEFVKYIKKDSKLHNLDPRAKLLLCITIILLSFLLTHPLVLLCIFLFVLSLSVIGKIHKEFFKRIKLLASVLIVAFILWSFLYKTSVFVSKQQSEIIFEFAGIKLDMLGLLYGITMPLRILIMIGTPLLFFMTTTFSDMILGLVKLRVPYSIAFIFGLSAKLIFSLGKEFENIKNAQMSRGLEIDKGNLFKRIRNYIPVLIPFTTRSLEISEQISIALDLKGFDVNKKIFYRQLRLTKSDWCVIIFSITALLIGLVLRFSFNWWL
jgi:energy-coupling factor transport system permease protein